MNKLLAIAVAVLVLQGCAPKNPEQDAALKGCTDFLKAAAKNPSSAEIPAPSAHLVSDSSQTLEWGHGAGLRFMNNMGAMLDTTATCTTTADGIVVDELILDGEIQWESDATRARREAAEAERREQARAARAAEPRIDDLVQAAVDAANAADAAADAAAEAAAAGTSSLD